MTFFLSSIYGLVNSVMNKNEWIVPLSASVDDFDFTWMPIKGEPPFIHQFGTQWQKTGGPKYVVEGATQVKYETVQHGIALPHDRWEVLTHHPVEFDRSWHHDDTDPPFIYVWGNQQWSSIMEPTVRYTVPGAKQVKYMDEPFVKIHRPPCDVFFVSNGEAGEEVRFNTLSALTFGRAQWVRGIKGRENALKRAAELSKTPWFFVFPGKLLADPSFDFTWHPRENIPPCHYIFYAYNPVNHLCYGHQAAVCYHRELALSTPTDVLDFTMAQPHDIVPTSCGVAQYHLDEFMCWRTAFREAVKLKLALSKNPQDHESRFRLHVWLTDYSGTHSMSEISVDGAKAGIQFFTEVNGDPAKLQASWDWEWLEKRYRKA